MARRGDIARQNAVNTIFNAFREHAIAIQDKKIYIETQDGPGGEWIQFAISLTMPKTPIAAASPTSTSEVGASQPATSTPAQISDEDAQKVQELMRALNVF